MQGYPPPGGPPPGGPPGMMRPPPGGPPQRPMGMPPGQMAFVPQLTPEQEEAMIEEKVRQGGT
jgi:hypothetical protein